MMRRRIGVALAASVLAAAGAVACGASAGASTGAARGAMAYVVSYGSGTVTPILLATNTPGHPIRVGKRPVAIAVTPDGKTAYVVNRDRKSVV